MNIKHLLLIATLGLPMLTSCDAFLDITPTGKVIAKTGEEYRALLTYAYKNFPEDRGLATLRGDELTLDKSSTKAEDYDAFFDIWAWNDVAPSSTTVSFGWRRYYHAIFTANYILERSKEITQIAPDERAQLIGEAYALRAYAHFLLANLYAPPYTHCEPQHTPAIPLALQADVKQVLKRSTLQEVYDQVLADLQQASQYLKVERWTLGKNYRFSTLSTEALRARVLLHMGRWADAQTAAEQVLRQRPELEDLNRSNAPLPGHYTSAENLQALEQVMTATYKNIGAPSASLLAHYGTGDLRKNRYYRQATASHTELRKGGSNEFACSFRTAECYLIAAEAAARQGDATTARRYLFFLAEHRYTAKAATLYKAQREQETADVLLEEILKERTRELAFEGFRWFDLRRTTRPTLQKEYDGKAFQLAAQDDRYTLRLPTEALEANPALAEESKP